MKNRLAAAVALGAAAALVLSGCSGSDAVGNSKTIKVAYQKFGTFTSLDDHMKEVKKAFEAAHRGITVELVPIQAQDDGYANDARAHEPVGCDGA